MNVFSVAFLDGKSEAPPLRLWPISHDASGFTQSAPATRSRAEQILLGPAWVLCTKLGQIVHEIRGPLPFSPEEVNLSTSILELF
jgi:hypothetical protein